MPKLARTHYTRFGGGGVSADATTKLGVAENRTRSHYVGCDSQPDDSELLPITKVIGGSGSQTTDFLGVPDT